MPYSTGAAAKSFLEQHVLNIATCWKIERQDGTVLRFTDFHSPIYLVGDTNAYSPAAGFNSSARQNQDNLKVQNLDVVGVIDSEAITFEDLMGGKYSDAKVTEYLVDYRFPFAGPIVENVYWVKRIKYDGESWNIELDGLQRWLELQVGVACDPVCRHDLGDSGCKVNIVSLTISNRQVTSIDTQRKIFRASTLTNPDGYFDYGLITWGTGNNAGHASEVKYWTQTGAILELQLPTPFDIQVGDEFSIYPGCDKVPATCKDKFSNFVNYGGFPYLPGQNKLMQTPEAR